MESKARGAFFNASVADIRASAVRHEAKNLGSTSIADDFSSAHLVAPGKTNERGPRLVKIPERTYYKYSESDSDLVLFSVNWHPDQ